MTIISCSIQSYWLFNVDRFSKPRWSVRDIAFHTKLSFLFRNQVCEHGVLLALEGELGPEKLVEI
jgi:hypothetical protein